MTTEPRVEESPRSGARSRLASSGLALGALLLAVGVGWLLLAQRDLPYLHHPDEPVNLRVVDAMVAQSDPNPHFFNYPSLFLYVHAALHLDGPLLGWLGLDESPPVTQVLGMSRSDTPGSVLLHRAVSVVAGLATVLAVHATTRRLTRTTAAPLGAASLLATCVTLTAVAVDVTPDALATALVAAATWAAVRLWQRPGWQAHLLAGALVGLAAATKYNGALVAVAVVAASALAPLEDREVPRRVGMLVTAGLAAAAAFVAATPYALLDREAFLSDLRFEREHYARGHPGMDGNTVRWYAEYLVSSETLLVASAAAGLVLVLAARRGRPALVVGAFPLVYLPFVASMAVRNDRTVLLVLPALAVLAGLGLDAALRAAPRPGPRRGSRAAWGTAAAAAALVLQLGRLVEAEGLGPSRWQESREWLEATVPPGSVVLAEAYSPWIDPDVYRLHTAVSLAEAPEGLEWDYAVASESMYGRYVADPRRFPVEAAAYERLFAGSQEVAVFRHQDKAVRVLARRDVPVSTGVPGGAPVTASPAPAAAFP